MFDDGVDIRFRDRRENHDLLQQESGFSQAHRFRKGGYCKGFDSVGSQNGCDAHRSMAVSIRFHHTGDLDTGSDLLLDLLDIKVQISNIDLSPGCA